VKDASTQFLYDYVMWQWPIRWVVTLAFYAFAFKLIAGVLRHVLLGLIRLKRWAITADLSLSPRDPFTCTYLGWSNQEEKGSLSVSRTLRMARSIAWAYYRWLSPEPLEVTTNMSAKDECVTRGDRLQSWI